MALVAVMATMCNWWFTPMAAVTYMVCIMSSI